MRKVGLLLASTVSVCLTLIPANQALAFTCPPGDVAEHYGVGGSDTPAGYANRSEVLVNGFWEHQNHTWRAVGIFQNGSNFVEMGWVVKEDYDQNAHPYRSWVNNGVLGTGTFALIDVPQGPNQYVQFGVRDTDDNNNYNFIYDGDNSFSDTKFASINAGTAFALSQSESSCSSDSMKARFTQLRAVHTQSGGWVGYFSLATYVDHSYLGQWEYSNETLSAYHVCNPPACSF
jgi:hypothetical protein